MSKTMTLNEFLEQANNYYKSLLEDETITYYYDTVSIQEDFLFCIQQKIGSSLVIMTQEEFDKKLKDYHESEKMAEYISSVGEF